MQLSRIIIGIPFLLLVGCVVHYPIAVVSGDECMRTALVSGDNKFKPCAEAKYSHIHNVDQLKSALTKEGFECKEFPNIIYEHKGKMTGFACWHEIFVLPILSQEFRISCRFTDRNKIENLEANVFSHSP